jgi:hypothetical protein
MIILFIVLGVLALPFIIALFVSKDMSYSKAIEINSTPEKVWPHVNSLGALDKWSPWNEKDPNMKRTFTGQDGTPGACQAWVSDNKNVGEGSQTIVKLTPNKRLDTRLDFIKPFKSTAAAFVTLDDKGGKTIATWGFESKMPYPMNIMKLFMNMEKNMDKDFGQGLSRLKEIAEK